MMKEYFIWHFIPLLFPSCYKSKKIFILNDFYCIQLNIASTIKSNATLLQITQALVFLGVIFDSIIKVNHYGIIHLLRAQIFRKTNSSYPLVHTPTYAYRR